MLVFEVGLKVKKNKSLLTLNSLSNSCYYNSCLLHILLFVFAFQLTSSCNRLFSKVKLIQQKKAQTIQRNVKTINNISAY